MTDFVSVVEGAGQRAEFVPRAWFKAAVVLAVRAGKPPHAYLPPGPLIVHPEAVEWYMALLAHERVREHFGMVE